MTTPMQPRGDGWDGDEYQARFDALAAKGVDVHGEATFVMAYAPTSVLDAGCGTGRVARELAARGVEVVGADADESMIATAARENPTLEWHVVDLVDLDLGRTFDVVVMAGNVPLFTAFDSLAALVAGCARHVAPGGVLIAGFQLGRGYELADYDAQCAAAGLTLTERFATWDRASGAAPDTGGTLADTFATPADRDYAVSVHRRA